MNLTLTFLITLLFTPPLLAVNLLQETQDIYCDSNKKQIFIEKKDRYFETNNVRYESIEFLDKGILGKSTKNQFALLQMTPQNTATLIEGEKLEYRERDCKQVKAFKVCTNQFGQIKWSPTSLEVGGETFDLQHYGVYPNDGTFFIAYKNGKTGVALIDFGANFLVISGRHSKLSCSY